MTIFFKLICLIEDDESFECAPLTRMRKRRFSSDGFQDGLDEVKASKELNDAIKKQNYLLSISQHGDNKKKLDNLKKFSRIVLIVIFMIRDKIEQARLIRDEKFMETAGVMENSVFNAIDIGSSKDDEDDNVSLGLDEYKDKLSPRRKARKNQKKSGTESKSSKFLFRGKISLQEFF